MKIPEIPLDEQGRLEALHDLNILDTPSEQEYEDLVRLASTICNTPMSLVTLIDAHRQWFKARIGIDDQETDRDTSFCAHAIHSDEMMIVPDAQNDTRFFDNPNVTDDPHVRFYAGMPLVTRDGYKLGTLCVIDRVPRNLTDEQIFALRTLGKQVINTMELRQKNRKLNELNALQNKFLAIISHDVKGPLTGLKSLIHLLDDDNLSREDFNAVTQHVNNQVDQCIDLLNNLVDWGMSQMKSNHLQLHPMDLHRMVHETFEALKQQAEKKSLRLENAVMPGTLVLADENMLKFIVRNLAGNAIKFTAKGSVTINCEENAKGWVINVTDTGVGIPLSRMDKLFSWEKRYTTHGTDNEAGSGLGLLLCKEFAEKHHGNISILSEPGAGTTFKVALNTKG